MNQCGTSQDMRSEGGTGEALSFPALGFKRQQNCVRYDFGLCAFARTGFSSARQRCLTPGVLGTSRAAVKMFSRQQKDVLMGLDPAQSELTAANELPCANAAV